ncbi:MAG: DUF4097 family beta strand repeat-containing protein [Ktedonobacteraceae bacterium]|nr:DUF4097 family beta strand repeat-containing protein [Chloroflexota bacterium]
MNEQEMQFADPEWRPPEDGMVQAQQVAPEPYPYVPQPINREPAMSQTTASVPPSDVPPLPVQPRPYVGGYAPQQMGSRQYGVPARKSRSPWFLIIAVIIGFSLLSGGFSRGDNSHSPNHWPPGIPWGNAAPQLFVVGTSSVPTIVIQGQSGNIQINRGLDTDKVTVDTANKNAVQYNKDSNQLTVNDTSDDLTVTVPGNAILQINTQSGDIDVQGVDGQMNLVSNSGTIHVEHSTLKGQSIMKSDSGSVTFNGSLDPSGSYQFESNSDAVNVTLPASAFFHVDASTNSGSIDSDFQVQPAGTQMHGDVGNQPRPTITLKTDSGDIHLHQAS